MAGETKRVLTLFFPFDYDREEDLINSMSEKGWQLVKGGAIHHTYRKNDQRYRYRLDFNTKVKHNMEEAHRYFSLFEEQGWEHINSLFNGWHYFRKPFVPNTNEEDYHIYTDSSSLKEMQGRWSRIARILQVLLLPLLIIYIKNYIDGLFASSGFLALLIFSVMLMLQVCITGLKRKRNAPDRRTSKGFKLTVILLFSVMLALYSLSLYSAIYGFPVKAIEISTTINQQTPDFHDTLLIKRDGHYKLDVKCKSERGMVGIRILKDHTIVYDGGAGMEYTLESYVYLEKGEYDIEIAYYLEDYAEVFPEGSMEALNLTGDLDELSEVNLSVEIKR